MKENNMNKILLSVIGLVFATSLAQAALNVVATTADLGAIAKEIGANKIEITVLGKPTEDPHFVDAKPSFIVKLNHADAVVEGGAELEIGWLPALIDQARNSKIVNGAPGHISCAAGVPLLDVPTTLDRSRGDIHAAGNPHYIIAPSNAKIVAKNIADGFCTIDPKSADLYRANLKTFVDGLDEKLVAWRKKLAPFQGQSVVAYHDSWPYFAKEFGLKIDLFLEPKPGIPPTPAHLADVIVKMKQENAHVIIVDPYLNRKTADTVASHTGAKVVEVTQFPGGVKGTEDGYSEMVDHDVNAIAAALAQK
jgi:zinc/manganese transport system substrate-binding protein